MLPCFRDFWGNRKFLHGIKLLKGNAVGEVHGTAASGWWSASPCLRPKAYRGSSVAPRVHKETVRVRM